MKILHIVPGLNEPTNGIAVAAALERRKRVITTDGAPAWAPQPKDAEVEKRGGGGQWTDRLLYLRGFRDGTDEARVKLLKDALMSFNKGVVE